MKNPYKFPLIAVTWADAIAECGWHNIEEITRETLVSSVGWLIRDDKYSLALAGTIGTNEGAPETVNQIMVIPAGMVVAREVLLEAGPEDDNG